MNIIPSKSQNSLMDALELASMLPESINFTTASGEEGIYYPATKTAVVTPSQGRQKDYYEVFESYYSPSWGPHQNPAQGDIVKIGSFRRPDYDEEKARIWSSYSGHISLYGKLETV